MYPTHSPAFHGNAEVKASAMLTYPALREFAAFDSETQAKKNIVQMIKEVAMRLGNTPSVCRKCYIHPAVLDSYLSGTMTRIFRIRNQRKTADLSGTGQQVHILHSEELVLTRLLRRSRKLS